MSDPGWVALMLDDTAENICWSGLDLNWSIVVKMVEMRDPRQAAWRRRAEQAITIGDETLARAALRRKGELTQEKR